MTHNFVCCLQPRIIQQTFSCPSVSPRLARGRAGAGWGSLSRTEVRLVGRGNCSEEHCGSLRARTHAHRLSRDFHVLEALSTPYWYCALTRQHLWEVLPTIPGKAEVCVTSMQRAVLREGCLPHLHLAVALQPIWPLSDGTKKPPADSKGCSTPSSPLPLRADWFLAIAPEKWPAEKSAKRPPPPPECPWQGYCNSQL